MTVTVSSTVPTFMSALTFAVNAVVSSMPSRLTVLKPGQREGDGVDARPEVDDLVRALAVGDDACGSFQSERGCGFDRDPGQNRARGILHDARDGTRHDAWANAPVEQAQATRTPPSRVSPPSETACCLLSTDW